MIDETKIMNDFMKLIEGLPVWLPYLLIAGIYFFQYRSDKVHDLLERQIERLEMRIEGLEDDE